MGPDDTNNERRVETLVSNVVSVISKHTNNPTKEKKNRPLFYKTPSVWKNFKCVFLVNPIFSDPVPVLFFILDYPFPLYL